tara:strand:+ start:36 stop:365 length:330 start_codon:yes stop_codon:yes gene_type:complete
MKSGLIFKENGEIEAISIKGGNFSPENFSFSNCDNNDKYAILYNTTGNKNITIFPFTKKTYFGDVLLIKKDKNNMIKNLNIKDYDKILLKIKEKFNDSVYISSSDEDFI